MESRRYARGGFRDRASSVAGQHHPNLERGFNEERLYQFNEVDRVSLFNGNLTATIPIGIEFPLGGN